MRLSGWLYPGLKLKRWLLLFALGFVALVGGVGIILPGRWFQEGVATRTAAAILIPGGMALSLWAASKVVRAFAGAVTHSGGPRQLAETFYHQRQLERGPRIVAIGGGTGLPVLLRGLKEYTSNLTAIVTVGDDGGSSGRLRGEMGILPPGDLRNCLLALADTEPLLESLFAYRFNGGGEGLSGHNFGNLFIAAMSQITGDFGQAIRASSQVLAVRGQVLPATLENLVLQAEMEDGSVVRGETAISQARKKICRLSLDPPTAQPVPEALEAIAEAEAIILGPGSLYTSILPNLMITGIAEAIRASRARKIYVCNCMTQPGETAGFTASDHVRAILEHVGSGTIEAVVVNVAPIREEILAAYRLDGAEPVRVDAGELANLGVRILGATVVGGEKRVRHDPLKLARVVLGDLLDSPVATRRFWDFHLLSERLREEGGGR